jgi:hypothetical protein
VLIDNSNRPIGEINPAPATAGACAQPFPSVSIRGKKVFGRILHFGGNFGISIQTVLENHGAVNP